MWEEFLSNGWKKAGGKIYDPTLIRTIALNVLNHVNFRLCYLPLNFAMLQPTLY